MSSTHPRFTIRIGGPPETIFELVADMPNYGRWLPGSDAFGGTTEVVPYPVRLGTTYLDAGPAGQRPGSVTEFDPPRRIGFHHTMLLKRGPLAADIDVHIRYTLEPIEQGTFVIRELDLTIQMGIMKLALPLVLYAFRTENVRILSALKRYAESSEATRHEWPK
jgi:uncharacterized protein YndB with AHSA1/START domain